jgi:hypothetical protein
MGALALLMFVTLFAFGQKFMGWSDPHGKVQLAMFATFCFGIICGWQTRGPGSVGKRELHEAETAKRSPKRRAKS